MVLCPQGSASPVYLLVSDTLRHHLASQSLGPSGTETSSSTLALHDFTWPDVACTPPAHLWPPTLGLSCWRWGVKQLGTLLDTHIYAMQKCRGVSAVPLREKLELESIGKFFPRCLSGWMLLRCCLRGFSQDDLVQSSNQSHLGAAGC